MSLSSSPDHAKATAALKAAASTAAAALDALQATQNSNAAPAIELAVLRKDYTSILTLLYSAVTKVALALRPPKQEWKAALQPINDMGSATVALSSCASLFSVQHHGASLRTQARNLASDVLRTVQQLASTIEDDTEDLYVRTGALHDAIDRARNELPASELDAVRDLFRANQACLDDGLPELQELIEEDECDHVENDDDWDAFGDEFASSKLSPEERQRVKEAYPLVKLITQLHKKILSDYLSPKRDPQLSMQQLEAIRPLSTDILSRFEDVVAALYGPQEAGVVHAAVSAILSTVASVKPLVLPGQDDISTGMEGLSLSSEPSKSTKWFQLCFAQIEKLKQPAVLGT
ncbi:hypothetical protein AURDEDRAFT_185146 [Auricularia subglabra TFB-10046 SS5]|nr:hypothetical protein AURDEDRAFT_185146 [Auricularia subglabra TFB-10046 SS5]